MPLLRRPHDHHRELRARLLSALPSCRLMQHRHVMTTIHTTQSRNARRSRQSSSAHDDARSNPKLHPQLDRSSSFEAGRSATAGRPSNALNSTAAFDRPRRIIDRSPAPIKSPQVIAAPPTYPCPRFPPLEAFGRRPSEPAAPSLIGPASETLHTPGNAHREDMGSALPLTP